jgi:hypothetical protein
MTPAIEGARAATEDRRWAVQRGGGCISAAGGRLVVDGAEGWPVPEEDEEAVVRPRGRHGGCATGSCARATASGLGRPIWMKLPWCTGTRVQNVFLYCILLFWSL